MLSWITAISDFIAALSWLVEQFKVYQAAQSQKDLENAVDTAVSTGDQTGLEKAIGDDNAGLPTKDTVPGLKTRPTTDHSG